MFYSSCVCVCETMCICVCVSPGAHTGHKTWSWRHRWLWAAPNGNLAQSSGRVASAISQAPLPPSLLFSWVLLLFLPAKTKRKRTNSSELICRWFSNHTNAPFFPKLSLVENTLQRSSPLRFWDFLNKWVLIFKWFLKWITGGNDLYTV